MADVRPQLPDLAFVVDVIDPVHKPRDPSRNCWTEHSALRLSKSDRAQVTSLQYSWGRLHVILRHRIKAEISTLQFAARSMAWIHLNHDVKQRTKCFVLCLFRTSMILESICEQFERNVDSTTLGSRDFCPDCYNQMLILLMLGRTRIFWGIGCNRFLSVSDPSRDYKLLDWFHAQDFFT